MSISTVLADAYINGLIPIKDIENFLFNVYDSFFWKKIFCPISNIFEGRRLARVHTNEFVIEPTTVLEEHYNKDLNLLLKILGHKLQYTGNMVPECKPGDEYNFLDAGEDKKLDSLTRDIKKGDLVFDIGAGLEGVITTSLEKGAEHVHAITPALDQAEYLEKKHTTNSVTVHAKHYIDLPNIFPPKIADFIFLIEVDPHIFLTNLPHFAKVINYLLKPGGNFIMQSLYSPYSSGVTNAYVRRDIFQDARIHSKEQLLSPFSPYFQFLDEIDLTQGYVRTLRAWHQFYLQAINKGEIIASKKEIRTKELYHLGFAASLHAENIKNSQFFWEKKQLDN